MEHNWISVPTRLSLIDVRALNKVSTYPRNVRAHTVCPLHRFLAKLNQAKIHLVVGENVQV
jgi:hypothetical protein